MLSGGGRGQEHIYENEKMKRCKMCLVVWEIFLVANYFFCLFLNFASIFEQILMHQITCVVLLVSFHSNYNHTILSLFYSFLPM